MATMALVPIPEVPGASYTDGSKTMIHYNGKTMTKEEFGDLITPKQKASLGKEFADMSNLKGRGDMNIMGGDKPRYQILNVEAMEKYTPDQYERLADGSVVLNKGVEPVEGTVKEIKGKFTQKDEGDYGSFIEQEKLLNMTPEERAAYDKTKQQNEDKMNADITGRGDRPNLQLPSGQIISGTDPNYDTYKDQAGTTVASGEDQADLPEGAVKTVDSIEDIIDAVAESLEGDATEEEIMEALEKIKTEQVDPYYKQLIGQIQSDTVEEINRTYEARVRELEAQSYNLAENIKNTQANLESRGMTFSGQAVEKLGALSAFAQPAAVQPGVEKPQELTMTPEQAGLEGSTLQANRLMAESTTARYQQRMKDIKDIALRKLGTEGMAGLGIEGTSDLPQTTGTTQYDYNTTLQGIHSGLSGQSGDLSNYQKLFI
jgi:hypothetical protein